MKVIGDFLKGLLITIWVLVAIAATVCLIQRNKFGTSEFGDYRLFVVDTSAVENYKKNDLVITKKGMETDYNENDYVFFYYGNVDTNSYINLGKIDSIDRNKNAEDTFHFGELSISYGNIIGNGSGTKVVHNLGILLNLFESKWGFMFLVILPTIYAMVYEVYAIVREIKKEAKKE